MAVIEVTKTDGALPAVTISPVAHGVDGLTIVDDSANTLYEVENIAADSLHYAPALVLSSSYGRAGSGGRAWGIGIDVSAATPYRDLAIYKVGGVDGQGAASTAYDFLYFAHRGTSPPTLLVGNSSFTPAGQVELVMAADGSGNVLDTTLHNLRIHTALITGGNPSNQTTPAISVVNWTSGHDRFHVECDGGLLVNDSGGTQVFKVDGSNSGNTAIKGVLNIGSDASGTSHNLLIKNGASNTDISLQTDSGGSLQIQCLNASGTVNIWSTNNSVIVLGTNSTQALKLTTAQSVLAGKSGITTSATDGFLYVAAAAGTPTGTPTAQAGFAPIYYDTTNHKLWVYDGGWKGVVVS